MKKNIFVLGTDEFNLVKLMSLSNAADFNFHMLLSYSEIRGTDIYPVKELLEKAETRLSTFSGSIDGLVGYYDFPVTDMIPILAKKFNVPAASLESVLKCEHKFWSRVEQRKAVPEHVPNFKAFDPFDENALEMLENELGYPFWMKPVKSFRSYLGYMVKSREDFNENITTIRNNIRKISEPFDYLLDFMDKPDKMEDIGGHFCLAEAIISGRQCTIEGFSYNGKVETYGIIDSIRDPNRSTFARYEYPSKLPRNIQDKMSEISVQVIKQIGFDNSCFNIEFFYNEADDKIWLLEINPRISQSHGDLFQKVDGISNHEIMVNIANGHKPHIPHRKGLFNHAAKFMLRRFEDGIVKRVPTHEEIRALGQRFPGTFIEILVQEGTQLSELLNQDSYSFEIADIYMGASNTHNMLENYHAVVENLGFEFEEV